MDDKTLIGRILNNDDRAFNILVGKYQKLVYSTCFRLVNNQADAEDIFQEVFVEVARSVNHVRNDSDISSWLFKIAYNKSLSFLRKRNPAKASPSDNFYSTTAQNEHHFFNNENPHMMLEQAESQKVLFSAIDQLPENQKKVLLMHKFEDYSQKEICEQLNLSQASVESLIYRAKVNLRKSLVMYFKNIE